MSKFQTQTKKIELSNNIHAQKIRQIAKKQIVNIKTGNKVLQVPIRVPVDGHLVIVDAINYVTSISAYDLSDSGNFEDYCNSVFLDNTVEQSVKDALADELAIEVATTLGDIFGSDFTNLNRNVKGLHGYKYQYTIGCDDYVLGKVCFGGNNGTVLTMITGKGCYQAMDCWEYNLYDFLNGIANSRITRIDLALDDFSGEFSSAELANQADTDGKFALTNNLPSVQHLGDWKRHNGAGRTLQVGKRENGKMYRGYEKGKQLGDKNSLWFRSEIEFKNKDRHLPLDMLLKPTDYFAGAYPYAYELVEYKFNEIFQSAKRIETMKNESEISFKKSVSVMKRQFGKYIKVFRELIPDIDGKSKDTIILDLIQTDKVVDYVPKRLKVTDGYFNRLFKEPLDNQVCAIPF